MNQKALLHTFAVTEERIAKRERDLMRAISSAVKGVLMRSSSSSCLWCHASIAFHALVSFGVAIWRNASQQFAVTEGCWSA
jgi:hypothetical protein